MRVGTSKMSSPNVCTGSNEETETDADVQKLYQQFRSKLKKATGSTTLSADMILALSSGSGSGGGVSGSASRTNVNASLQHQWDRLPLWKKRMIRRQVNLQPKAEEGTKDYSLITNWVKRNRIVRKESRLGEGRLERMLEQKSAAITTNTRASIKTTLSEDVEDALMGIAAEFNDTIVEAMVSDGKCRERNTAAFTFKKMKSISKNMVAIEHDLGQLEKSKLSGETIQDYQARLFGVAQLGKDLRYDFNTVCSDWGSDLESSSSDSSESDSDDFSGSDSDSDDDSSSGSSCSYSLYSGSGSGQRSLGSLIYSGSVNALSRGRANDGNVCINLNGETYIVTNHDDSYSICSSTGDDESYLDAYLEEFVENFYVPDV